MKRVLRDVMLGGGCALLVACAGDDEATTSFAIQVHVPLATSPCDVASATASLSGPVRHIDPTPLEVTDDAIHGALLDVPVGRQHQVFVEVYDSSGLEVYSGNSTVDVTTGIEIPASIFLSSNGKNCPGGGTENSRLIGRLEQITVDAASGP
ncbi:hypothetical protein LZ198_09420 [Myxococcus sp. K15C18031901]|uniref:hypothetical protein n=1 Tax=Myxococcus dinghuensis TaxID=2906761 RepID=UPI0020A76345|nr:hypothetical protein [Myxococcus dinghuensis]MCP3099086.1 hypothetical protein [Myxococcus dinghuensis]